MSTTANTIEYLFEVQQSMDSVTDVLKRFKEQHTLSQMEIDLIDKAIDEIRETLEKIKEREKKGGETCSLLAKLKRLLDGLITRLLFRSPFGA